MKFTMITLLASLHLFLGAQSLSFKAGTGDAELDLTLNNLNIEAKADLADFKAELSASYNLDGVKIEACLKKEKMEPADVFIAAEIAAICKKPIDVVISSYKVNSSKGWGFIAKQMGIKPGSAEFKALKSTSSAKLSKRKNSNKNKGAKGSEKTSNGNSGGGKKK